MEEANTEGTCQPTVAPLISCDFHEKSEVDNSKHQIDQEQMSSSHDSNHHDKLEGNGTNPDNSADQMQMQAESSSHKAPEITEVVDHRAHIDTAAPIDSVKGAVSKFGGILDWKERRKHIQSEFDKVQEEATECQKRSQEAEARKAQVLLELGSTKQLVEELRQSLEKAQTEEARAQQDSEVAELRFRETQQGVSDSTVAKAELGVVKDRHARALADLQSAKAELESLQKEHAALAAEVDTVVERARESTAASLEAEKAVEDLAAELTAVKEELGSSQAAHVEAEERRMKAAFALEQEKMQWQIELEQADEEVRKLADELMASKDLESKVEATSELLVSLRAELFAHVEGALSEEAKEDERPTASARTLLERTKKELENVKASVEKAKDEVKCLGVAAASLHADLEKEKAELAVLRRKEGLASTSFTSLAEELSRVTSELAEAEERVNEEGGEDKMAVQLHEARRKAEQAKAEVRLAREGVTKAREEADIAKAEFRTMEARLEAVLRELFAANTSEQIATASATALLQECKPAAANVQSEGGGEVTLPVEEYNEMSRRARETEELAGKRVAEAVKWIQRAKDAEVRNLEKLAEVAKQTEVRSRALEAAREEADEAEFGKLAAERELRRWRAEHEQQRRAVSESSPRAGLAEISVFEATSSGDVASGSNPHILSPRGYVSRADMMGTMSTVEEEARPRKSFFPRMVMFLARKKAQSLK